jgi:NADPH:quinone reductase-like Zn-dependent oxidoreductase
MKAAIVSAGGAPPICGEFADPIAQSGQHIVRVTASALSHITRSRASGSHYSSSGGFPFVAGIDGTGLRGDGKRVYFILPPAPYGAMAERCPVDESHCVDLPDALDDVSAAAMAIPGMSSWAALVERARLAKGETVLINGATGTAGRLAVQIAKHLGAGKVIATGRNLETLQNLKALGADATVSLTGDEDALEKDFQVHFREGVDVVLDYLWGPSAELLLIAAAKAGAEAVPIRFVQVGAASAPAITLPSAALRSSALQLMGSGMGSIPLPRLLKAIEGVLHAARPSGFQVATTPTPLQDVTRAWGSANGDSRIVFTI